MKKALYIIGAYLVIQAAAGLVAQLYTIAAGFPQPHTIPASTLLTLLFACSVLTAIVTILICRNENKRPFKGLQGPSHSASVLLLSAIATIPLIAISNCLTEITGLPDNLASNFAEMCTSVWALPVMAVFGSLSEEICFRYGVTGVLLKQMPSSPTKAIVASALIFGIIHMNPAQIMGATLLGMFFAWLYVKTNSIWPSVICHILNNSIAVITLQTMPRDISISKMLPAPGYIYLVLIASIIVAIPLLWTLNKVLPTHQTPNNS